MNARSHATGIAIILTAAVIAAAVIAYAASHQDQCPPQRHVVSITTPQPAPGPGPGPAPQPSGNECESQ